MARTEESGRTLADKGATDAQGAFGNPAGDCPDAKHRPARVYPDSARLRYYAGLGLSQGEDDQDRFSLLQQSVLPEGPDSISFYNARVKTEQKVTWDIHVCEGGGPKDFVIRILRITNLIR